MECMHAIKLTSRQIASYSSLMEVTDRSTHACTGKLETTNTDKVTQNGHTIKTIYRRHWILELLYSAFKCAVEFKYCRNGPKSYIGGRGTDLQWHTDCDNSIVRGTKLFMLDTFNFTIDWYMNVQSKIDILTFIVVGPLGNQTKWFGGYMSCTIFWWVLMGSPPLCFIY